jgi:uncharacterized repeat protein (TIGR01451 family)
MTTARIAVISGLITVSLMTGVAAAQPEGGMVRSTYAWPTGERSTSALLIERFVPPEITVGVPFEYQLNVTNLMSRELSDIEVGEQVPDGFRIVATGPQAQLSRGRLRWRVPSLGPQQTMTFRIQVEADRTGQPSFCVSVTLGLAACSPVTVVQPALALQMKTLARASLCDAIPLIYTVTNTGTGTLRNVVITDYLPQGVTEQSGRNAYSIQVGDLDGGQSREYTMNVRAGATGTFNFQSNAIADGGYKADARTASQVVKPSLKVTKAAPATVFLNRGLTSTITVTNDGDDAARNLVLVDRLAGGAEFVSATDTGQGVGTEIRWNLGTLNPGESRTVTNQMWVRERGPVWTDTEATADCASAKIRTSLDVRGVPALLLEVRDDPDPIEKGADVTYEIVVTNQGTAETRNIVLICKLPSQQQHVSSEGPTQATLSAGELRFGAVAMLAPKAKVTYKVTVKGIDVGDVRFKVEMTSDELKTPVEETESTHIYE